MSTDTTTIPPIVVAHNAQNEIVDVQEADQFQISKTQFACGFFTCAILRSMVRPGSGQKPTLTDQQVINDALSWYAQYDGTPAITNVNGMTEEQLYELLHQIGLHYQATQPTADTARKWLAAGYPLAAAVWETSIRDFALGDVNPYPWKAAGSHVISLTGVDAHGNFLVRDSANCTNLYDPNSLRPGPRTYDANNIQFVSLTVVVPPWMPQPESATPPVLPPVEADPSLKVPAGWHDDGSMLSSPNGGYAILGFRHYILTHPWDPADMPLGSEQAADPLEIGYTSPDGDNKGSRLLCMYTELGYTPKKGVFVISVGREFATALARLTKISSTPVSPASPIASPPGTAASSGEGVSMPALVMGMKQNLSPEDLLISWSVINSSISYEPTRAIPTLWRALLQAGYGIGAVISTEMAVTIAGLPVTVQLFEGGRIFQAKERDGASRVWPQLVGGQSRLPGTPTT